MKQNSSSMTGTMLQRCFRQIAGPAVKATAMMDRRIAFIILFLAQNHDTVAMFHVENAFERNSLMQIRQSDFIQVGA